MFPLVDPWHANWSPREREVKVNQYPVHLNAYCPPRLREKHGWADTLAVQLLFSIYMGLDACALVINGSDKFYLFMDLHARQQWVSYNMNSRKWLAATNEFDSRLEALNTLSQNILGHSWNSSVMWK
ncbi:hypothetical protein BC827DRAFT_1270251 [Russula dissimulans]|nr:hypothetical protein BC827DRAFT_1270251 [Russula dissimulans]